MAGFNLWSVFSAVVDAVPERDCLVWTEQRLTFREVESRASGLAGFLTANGLGCRLERNELLGHESGQSHVGLLLYNGPEYLESMLGAFAARAAPFNINYRYTGDELRHLLSDACADAIVFHSSLAPTLETVLPSLPNVKVLIQVPDGSGVPLIEGAVSYEQAVGSHPRPGPLVAPSPDDLYLLYQAGPPGCRKESCGASTTSSWLPWEVDPCILENPSPPSKLSPLEPNAARGFQCWP